ncbi:MAG TPA: protein tyrosine phosphatase [Candidatus Binatia bacterium]|jgi:predicted protein tyrosine phosphatase|nr:protein tyrosine phosphatase [Candidatus Binatia bacterium]
MLDTERNQQQKLLFICSCNQRRSVTAERLFDGCTGYEVQSAGTEHGARTKVAREHIEWADMIFVMEPKHLQRLRSKFKEALKGKRLICLQVPDKFGCMTLELMKELRQKVSLYLPIPR